MSGIKSNIKDLGKSFEKMKNPLKDWAFAKNQVHDTSGIENPEKFEWELFEGVYYPVMWDVLSPDGFAIHFSNRYESEQAAGEALKQWIKRYEGQGYYSSNRGRIALGDLIGYCEIVRVVIH